ncbi:hypothetical protein CYMTET_49622 [Cymbomonas tetramitiformis]|uniref:Uncharacterized protein n=1 Tax=Cymbomonas tetramitiformis TaxID=36881 RepID=A0AAE0BPU4_9CHLO|nr:hypothetical protein CYMTET_49622 [Cymbomonas tetramitiformis]
MVHAPVPETSSEYMAAVLDGSTLQAKLDGDEGDASGANEHNLDAAHADTALPVVIPKNGQRMRAKQ